MPDEHNEEGYGEEAVVNVRENHMSAGLLIGQAMMRPLVRQRYMNDRRGNILSPVDKAPLSLATRPIRNGSAQYLRRPAAETARKPPHRDARSIAINHRFCRRVIRTGRRLL